jgi:cytochrome bd-type quinol oxidase subunit 2
MYSEFLVWKSSSMSTLEILYIQMSVILFIQIRKHVHREYEQKDTNTENEKKNARTRNTHTQ